MSKVGKQQLTQDLSQTIDTAFNFASNDTNVKWAIDTGTANAKVVTVPLSTSAYGSGGMGISFKNAVANTGAVTIDVNGMGVKPVVKSNGSPLANGALKADSVYTVRYNGTSFILQGEGGEYGTAVAADVLVGKTFGTEDGLVNGAMVNRGSIGTQNLTSQNASYTIPQGYHNGSGKVQATYQAGKRIETGTIPRLNPGETAPRQFLSFNPRTVIVTSAVRSSIPELGFASKEYLFNKPSSEQFYFGYYSGTWGIVQIPSSGNYFDITHNTIGSGNYTYALYWVAYE